MTRILIADDSPIMRRNLRAILTEAGCEIAAEAANGEEAVLAYRRHRPDLVTMDITMPVMDGIQAVDTIVREFPDARIVVISAFDQRSMLFEAMEKGAKRYLIKPITADKLLQTVQLALDPARDEAPAAMEPGVPFPAGGERSARPADGDDDDAPLFAVENRSGRFVIRFTNPQRAADIPQLLTAVQGLLFVKPLQIAFDFAGAPELHPELLHALDGLITRIREADGEATIAAQSPALADKLLNRRIAAPVIAYLP